MIFPNPYHRHTTALALQKVLTPEKFDSYFKFGFVRNPWDWHVSLYKYPLQKRTHHQRDLFRKLGSFENYIEWLSKRSVMLQKNFLYDQDKQLVDFIGKMENLEHDFNIICQKIGIDTIALPHLNKSNSKYYREFYNDKTKDIIYKLFKKDIELFQYEF